MKPEAAFRALTANRKQAARKFGVFRITKAGTPAKQPSWTESTEEAANQAAERIRGLNPGREFVVAAL